MAAGAQWNVGGAGQNSGANVGGLAVGSGYTVNYNSITNWASPAGTPVTISGNSATTAVANYHSNGGRAVHDAPAVALGDVAGMVRPLGHRTSRGSTPGSMTPGVLATGFSDYGGLGENIDWQLAPVLTGFYYGYMASSDPTMWMDGDLRGHLISLETIEPDGYPGWPSSAPAGTSTDELDWYYADSLLGDAAAFRPIVLMAHQMITNPALKAAYGAKGQTYLALAKTLYQKWVWRGGWRDTDPAYYPGGMTCGPAGGDGPGPGYTTWITNP